MDNVTPKPRRLGRIVLVASLALNIAMIGAVAGLAFSENRGGATMQRMKLDFGAVGRVLDHDDRRAIGERIRRNGSAPVSRGAMRGQVKALAEALRIEPFDKAEVTEIMNSFRSRSTQMQESAQAAFVAHLAAMTPQERAEIADRLERNQR